MTFEETTELMDANDPGWCVDPNDDRTWVRMALSFLVLGVMVVVGLVFWRWMNPPSPVVRVNIPVALGGQYAMLYISAEFPAYLQAILIVGSNDYKELIRRHQVPPRCRNVPKGAGCIDWLEPGEKDWDVVLKSRPAEVKR